MKRGLFPLVGCALLAAMPAQAQKRELDPALVQIPMPAGPATSFVVRRDAEVCSSGNPAGNASGTAIAAGLGIDGRSWLRVSGKAWQFEPGKPYRIGVLALNSALGGFALARRDARLTIEVQGFRDAAGWSGIVAGPGARIFAPAMALYRDGAAEPFAVLSNPFGVTGDAFRRCLIEVAKADRGSGEPPATPPAPRGSVASFVTNDDYPAAALRAGDQGRTAVRITVSAHGIAADCAVTESSGSARLDYSTCALLMRRARFTPALDAAGRPTMATFDAALRWVIPTN